MNRYWQRISSGLWLDITYGNPTQDTPTLTGIVAVYFGIPAADLLPVDSATDPRVPPLIPQPTTPPPDWSFLRAPAIVILAATDAEPMLLRGMVAVLLDEINTLREWDVSFQAAVAAATSLADLKTRVAALPSLADRTLSQARTAIANKINAGTVDT